jgi:hypothetical protein
MTRAGSSTTIAAGFTRSFSIGTDEVYIATAGGGRAPL